MLERNASVTNELAPPGATPTLDTLPRRLADFATLGEALDYAAKGRRGLNFHDARGTLTRAYTFAELREDALVEARRFIALGIKPGDRIALVAETGTEFAACFFGAVYAGAWPVPLPLPTSFGGRDAYVDQLGVQLKSCDASLFLYPEELADFCSGAADKAGVASRSWESLAERRAGRRRAADGAAATTSLICNIRAARPASRTASRSLTVRCSTTCTPMASASMRRPIACISLAALVPRHGPGRLLPLADRDATVGRLSEDRGFRAPAARLARHDHPQSGNHRSAIRRPSATTSARAG